MDNSSEKKLYAGQKIYIGIDVHKRTYYAVAVTEGEIVKKWRTAAFPQELVRQRRAFFLRSTTLHSIRSRIFRICPTSRVRTVRNQKCGGQSREY